MIFDYIRLAFGNILHRRLRSWLTMIGIFVGIVSVVALISLGQGMQTAINQEFESLGTNRIIITPGQVNFGPATSSIVTDDLTDDDLKVVARVRGVENKMPVLIEEVLVEFKGEKSLVTVWGTALDEEGLEVINSVKFLEVEHGRQAKPGDSKKAVVGYNIANEEFRKKIVKGSKITIGGKEFEVVGVQKKAGTGVHDVVIRIPIEDAREIFEEDEEISIIFVLTSENVPPSEVAEDITKALRRSRNVDIGKEDFQVTTIEQGIQQLNNILTTVQIVLIGITAISLIVGGIGIMNSMFTAVLERRREIGIMKSIGATNNNIMLLFLLESGMMGLVGGIIGVTIGMILGKLAEIVAIQMGVILFKAYLGLPLLFGALLFSFVVGVVSGTLPAVGAARLQPVEALRK